MDTRRAFGWLLAAVLALVTWYLAEPFLGWLLATGLLAFLLFPVHQRLESHLGTRLSAGLLTVLVVLVVVIPLGVGLYALVTRGADVLVGISQGDTLVPIRQTIERWTGYDLPLQSYVLEGADLLTGYVSERPRALLGQGLHAALGFLLLTFVLYYLLKDGRQFVAWLKRTTPLEAKVRAELFTSTDNMIWAVLKGHVFVALVQGLVAGVSLFATGVPNAGLLTVAMMILALVPIVGVAPVLGGALVYLALNGQPLGAAFVFAWGMTTVAITDDYLRAVLIDRESEMHSAFIFVGILGGSYLLGAMGLFVGPVLVGLFKTTVEVLGEFYGATDR